MPLNWILSIGMIFFLVIVSAMMYGGFSKFLFSLMGTSISEMQVNWMW